MDIARSADGTRIAYERSGTGPVIVVAAGALCDRTAFADLAPALAPISTVVRYDRRGRGDSGDAGAYAPAREVDDLAAVIDAVGGDAFVFGHSSGAILGLEAAAAGVPIRKLLAYEPPYTSRPAPGLIEEIQDLVAADRRGEAVSKFILFTGLPPEFLPTMQASPHWPVLTGLAHTLWHDLTIVGDGTPPVERLATITVPTLVADGGTSAAEMHIGAKSAAEAIPGARHVTVAGQGHNIEHEALVPLLTELVA